jgi:DNA-binding protein HU-beta
MASKGNSKIDALTALPGIGAATAKKLISAKIDTVSKIASAGSKKLQDAGLSAAVAKKIGAAAKTADKASKSAKKAATKAKTATKSTAKKTTAAAKKAASKTKSAAKKVSQKASKAKKTAVSKAKQTVKSSKSTDGRKGSTLRVPRSVTDMPWFKKK